MVDPSQGAPNKTTVPTQPVRLTRTLTDTVGEDSTTFYMCTAQPTGCLHWDGALSAAVWVGALTSFAQSSFVRLEDYDGCEAKKPLAHALESRHTEATLHLEEVSETCAWPESHTCTGRHLRHCDTTRRGVTLLCLSCVVFGIRTAFWLREKVKSQRDAGRLCLRSGCGLPVITLNIPRPRTIASPCFHEPPSLPLCTLGLGPLHYHPRQCSRFPSNSTICHPGRRTCFLLPEAI